MQQLGLKIDRPFASYEYRQGLIRLDSKLAAGVSRAADPGRIRQDARLYGSPEAQCHEDFSGLIPEGLRGSPRFQSWENE